MRYNAQVSGNTLIYHFVFREKTDFAEDLMLDLNLSLNRYYFLRFDALDDLNNILIQTQNTCDELEFESILFFATRCT